MDLFFVVGVSCVFTVLIDSADLFICLDTHSLMMPCTFVLASENQ